MSALQKSQTHIALNRTGDKMPLVGFGTARIPDSETEDAVYAAIKSGYRMIDGALVYRNEAEVGKAVKRAIKEGLVTRKDLFIVGKLWNHYHNKDHVRPAFEKTLESYRLDKDDSYLDLYLVHWPIPTDYVEYDKNCSFLNKEGKLPIERSSTQDCWKELEKLVNEGLIRNIGVSNFNVQSLVDLSTYSTIAPSVLEIEHHPYLQQARLINYARSQGIHTIAYASFGNTVFDKVPNNTAHIQPLMSHPIVEKIAKKHNRNAGQILLTWATQREIVVIPKSVKQARLESNLDLFSYRLDDEDMKELHSLEANARFNDIVEETFGFEFPIFC